MEIETPTDRLASLDEWGDRKFIIPGEVRGFWRKWRTRVQLVLLAIFLILPWTKINGMQSVWLDIPSRRFTLFGRVFLAHETPVIFLFFGIAVLGLSLATALWGRVWCGWACPQTVFIDGLYRRIEQWIEGSPHQRRRLRTAPLSLGKFTKVSAKWLAYIGVSSILAHSFIAYFSGAVPLLEMIGRDPTNNWGYFLTVTVTTGILAFNFGWFREQFCIIMCPYGRFQAVLMDDDSITVTYDRARGEPRRGLAAAGQRGDCVSCNRCVDVCPTAIDIRNGTQMECIGCTACMDACDEIMTKVNKPPKLIQYQSQKARGLQWRRPRVVANIALLMVFVAGLMVVMLQRQELYAAVLRAKDTPYQVLPSGEVINHFKLHLHNQSIQTQELEIVLPQTWQEQGLRLIAATTTFYLPQGQDKEVHFFIHFPSDLVATNGSANIDLKILATPEKLLPIQLLGPKTKR